MDNKPAIDTSVWIKVNKNSEIIAIIYDFRNANKYDIDIVLKLTLDELHKTQNDAIPPQEIFNELDEKYKKDILRLL